MIDISYVIFGLLPVMGLGVLLLANLIESKSSLKILKPAEK